MESQNPELRESLKEALDLTIKLYNTIVSIDDQFVHKMDKSETCRDIHDIQNRIYTIAYKNMEFFD